MAGSLLLLLDDIAAVLDDVSVMTKVAAKKTAGVIGDDLALNAEQVTGSSAQRELPIIWTVAKGSFWNKVVLVPAFLALSYFLPFLIGPILIIGGAFLAFEGVEKVLHSYQKYQQKRQPAVHSSEPIADVAFDETAKIKGAIRTDFILSAEIIAISLGTMATAPILQQALALSAISIAVTVLVYGLVAGIVKIDDLGFWMKTKASAFSQKLGSVLISSTPYLMRTLSIVGTFAMFLVGGDIIVHNLSFLTHLAHNLEHIGSGLSNILLTKGFSILTGAIVGSMIVWMVHMIQNLRGQKAAH